MAQGQNNSNSNPPENSGDERENLETEILDSLGYEDDSGDDSDGQFTIQGNEDDDSGQDENEGESSNSVRGQQQQNAQGQQDQQRQQNVDKQPKADSQGNIVDSTGKIIARAGNERRWWGEVQKANTQIRALAQQNHSNTQLINKARNIIGQMDGEIKGLREAQQLPQQLGLNGQEYAEALHLAARIKANPLEGVKILLTRLSENGIDISQLGVSGAGFDVGALSQSFKQQITEATKPFNDYLKNQQEQEQLANNAREGITEFFSQNPDATPYAEQIGRLMSDPQAQQRFGQLSMREAWLMIKNHLLANRQQSPTEHQPTGDKPRAMANGRKTPGVSGKKSIDNPAAPVDQDYRDILKDVFKDHNVRL